MSRSTPFVGILLDIASSLRKYWLLWMAPTLLLTAGAAAFAVLRQNTWSATQALVVRDEAIGGVGRIGRFESADALKKAQETVLELARNSSVMQAALRQVGPAGSGAGAVSGWPSQTDVRRLQSAIRVSAPRGAEFGQTEVIYLSVEAPSKKRAVALTDAVCLHLEKRLQQLRNSKAESVTGELEKTVMLAEKELAGATVRLEAMESEVGSDLAELRALAVSGSGDSNLRQVATQLENDLRTERSKQLDQQKILEYLVAAQHDPGQIAGMPNRLLQSHTALGKLKDGLVEAQLRTSQLLGSMHQTHPLVKAAISSEQEVRENIRNEVDIAIAGLTADMRVGSAQIDSLSFQLANLKAKLDRLAKLRSGYANLVNSVQQHSTILEKAQKDLSDARATHTVAESTSLITRVDSPVVSDFPVGPSRTSIVLAGIGGGLLTGLGLVFLVSARSDSRGRRWTDRFKGRRTADRSRLGRRVADQPFETTPASSATRENTVHEDASPNSTASAKAGGGSEQPPSYEQFIAAAEQREAVSATLVVPELKQEADDERIVPRRKSTSTQSTFVDVRRSRDPQNQDQTSQRPLNLAQSLKRLEE